MTCPNTDKERCFCQSGIVDTVTYEIPPIFVVSEPTHVGKTDMALQMAKYLKKIRKTKNPPLIIDHE